MSQTTDILKVSILGKESIHCGFHLIPHITTTVLESLPSSTYVLITDSHVAQLHLPAFTSSFNAAIAANASKARLMTYVVPPGETSKSRQGKAEIEDFLLQNRCTRDTVILAIGGGVIGDLVGFVAATFMRGVRFCQVPTTLLAMVDSSVGGKTAIDTPLGKNLIGAFWQPEFTFIDVAFLETLPTREFSNGMAEVVKTAAIWNEVDFALLESRSSEIFAAVSRPSRNDAGRLPATRSAAQELLLSVIRGSIAVKAHIVTVDERETGLRNLVNFGHTIGHAIEAVLTPTILHGECVSIGMILEAEIARSMGVLGQVAVGRLTRCLKAYNLPVSLADPRISDLPAAKHLTVAKLLDTMKVDKKNSGAEKKIVILSRIGATHEQKASTVQDNVIARALSDAARPVSGLRTKSSVTMATPGSKSISNRALVLAALSKGTCRLRNLLHSDDTQVMMAALIDLKGATFEWEDGGETLVVHGGKGSLSSPADGKEIYLGNAGTAARFLTTVCTLAQGPTVITGNARMKQRPCGPLVDALRANGSPIKYLESEGCLPLSIPSTGLNGGLIELSASVSSQYVSSILLCAPYAAQAVTLVLQGGQVISQPYIDMTVAMMRTFGIDVVRRTDPSTGALLDVYDIPQGIYTSPAEYSIESDASSATYPLAIAAITGTSCTITNIGSASLQGDARFAKDVLEPMGCAVTQTQSETTVTGPPIGHLKALGVVDMEPMTDAFLTAAVLAAVAIREPSSDRCAANSRGQPSTRIVGIANQRVKECNRIKAMRDELAKFGIETEEYEDGLEVYGKPIVQLRRNVNVHCYDDHRVAMAFSVLGCIIEGTVLEEKRCVEKTWPNWWDDLENKIGINVEGVDLPKPETVTSSTLRDTAASIILIGMRGSGKTYIGELATQALGWTFLDADVVFEAKHGTSVRDFVREKGWPAFREAETEILRNLLAYHSSRHVISLGGGIVETPAARRELMQHAKKGPVVHVVRNMDEIIQYLADEAERPAYGESVRDVFLRRELWYMECRTHEFLNSTGALNISNEKALEPPERPFDNLHGEVTRFFHHITGQGQALPCSIPNKRSYFLSLTYPDIAVAVPHIADLTDGIDAIELRVDLLRAPQDARAPAPYIPPTEYVAEQLARLRRMTSLPVIFTIRTVSQGGAFPDAAEGAAFRLLKLAARAGVEYIDVEVSWPRQRIRDLVACKAYSKIIASWHDWSGKMKWDGAQVREKFAIASMYGDVIKIVGTAKSLDDNFALRAFINCDAVKAPGKPVMALNMGKEGQMSRILNKTLTPVYHPRMPARAAPGQLSVAEIQSGLQLLGEEEHS